DVGSSAGAEGAAAADPRDPGGVPHWPAGLANTPRAGRTDAGCGGVAAVRAAMAALVLGPGGAIGGDADGLRGGVAPGAGGEARGALRASRDALRDVLEERFGTIPAELERRIDSVEDPEQLRRAHRRALRIGSPAELEL